MKYSLLFLTFLLLLTAGCDSGEGGESGIEGTWVQSQTDPTDETARYLRVTPATLTVFGVLQAVECRTFDDEYGLTSSDGTVFTFGSSSSERRLSLDGENLVVSRSGDAARYERTRLSFESVQECRDVFEPVEGVWQSADRSAAFSTFDAISNQGAAYFTEFDASNQCYREVAYLSPARVNGSTFTYRDLDSAQSFDFVARSEEITAPGGVSLSMTSSFVSDC